MNQKLTKALLTSSLLSISSLALADFTITGNNAAPFSTGVSAALTCSIFGGFAGNCKGDNLIVAPNTQIIGGANTPLWVEGGLGKSLTLLDSDLTVIEATGFGTAIRVFGNGLGTDLVTVGMGNKINQNLPGVQDAVIIDFLGTNHAGLLLKGTVSALTGHTGASDGSAAIGLADQVGNITITSTGTAQSSGADGIGIYVNSNPVGNAVTGSIDNSGVINGAGTGIFVKSPFVGTISNSGLGQIRSATGTGIILSNSVSGSITNFGIIEGGTNAINTTTPLAGTDINNFGSIKGNVILNKNTLTMNVGSSLTGNVVGTAASGKFIVAMGDTSYSSGTILSGIALDNLAEVNFNSGNITWNNPIGNTTAVTDVLIDTALLNLNASIKATNLKNTGTGTLALSKSIDLPGGTNFVQTGGTLQVTLFDKNNYGQLKVSGDLNMSAAGKLVVVVPGSAVIGIASGDIFDVVTVAGNVISDAAQFSGGTPTLSFEKWVAPNGKDIRLTAVRKPLSDISTPVGLGQLGTALDTIQRLTLDTQFTNLFNDIFSQSDNAGINRVLSNISSDRSGAHSLPQSMHRVFQLLHNRLEGVRLSQAKSALTGYNAGYGYSRFDATGKDHAIWMQGFGLGIEQKERKQIYGYQTTTLGFLTGYDAHMGPVLAGLSLGYSHSNVSSKNVSKNTSAIRTYLGNLYGSFDFEHSYLDFMLSLAQNSNKNVRNVPVGLTMLRALSNYSSSQKGARIAYSYPLHSGCLNIVPSLSAAYTGLSQRGYIERGAGSVGLNVQRLRHHVLDLGFGLQYDYTLKTAHGDYIPQFGIGFRHDVIGKPLDTRSTFIIGGPVFSIKGAPIAKTTLDLSAGFNMVVNESFNYVANINMSVKKNYKAQSATVTLRYRFG